MIRVCSSASIFRDIGPLAQDAVIGSALLESETYVSVLPGIEELLREGALCERQILRFPATRCRTEMDVNSSVRPKHKDMLRQAR